MINLISLNTISDVLRRIEELKRMEGNCGRAYRRFVKQMFYTPDGKHQMLSIEFHGYEDKELDALEYAYLCAYVESRSAEVLQELVASFSDVRFRCDVFERMFSIVGATLELRPSVDIDTVSLGTLRNIVADLYTVVFKYFEHYQESAVDLFVQQRDMVLTAEEEEALAAHVAGFKVELTPRAAQLAKYFSNLPRPAKSYLDELFGKAA